MSITLDAVHALYDPRRAGGGQVELLQGVHLPAVVIAYARNEEIYAEQEGAGFVYKVVSGAVRLTRLLTDGRRQIVAFSLPGEVFGLEAGAEHRFSAEALADSQVALVRRSTLEQAAVEDALVARRLWKLALADLQRQQEHAVLLGRKTAVERVAAFLLQMAQRQSSRREVQLPMCRLDIADYLGLTIETVSRTFSKLKRDQSIALPNLHTVVLNDTAELQRLDA